MAKVARNRIDPVQAKRLYIKLKNVNAVAKELGASYMGVRRNLLVQGVELVPAARTGVVAAAPSKTMARATRKPGEDDPVDVLARTIAASLMGDATVQVQPRTRDELWDSIRASTRAGLKQIGFVS